MLLLDHLAMRMCDSRLISHEHNSFWIPAKGFDVVSNLFKCHALV